MAKDPDITIELLRDLLRKHDAIKDLKIEVERVGHPNWETQSKKSLQAYLDVELLNSLAELREFAKRCAPKS